MLKKICSQLIYVELGKNTFRENFCYTMIGVKLVRKSSRKNVFFVNPRKRFCFVWFQFLKQTGPRSIPNMASLSVSRTGAKSVIGSRMNL